jgi:hypothetical protein
MSAAASILFAIGVLAGLAMIGFGFMAAYAEAVGNSWGDSNGRGRWPFMIGLVVLIGSLVGLVRS